MRHAVIHRSAAFLLVFIACSACSPPDGPATAVTESRVVMGTELHLTAWAPAKPAAAAFAEVFSEFERLEALLSVWRDGSDVVRLNAAAGGEPVKVSPETLGLLLQARRYSELSAGKFDITFGPLSGLWRFDHDQDNVIPDAAAVAARLPLIAWEDLELDEAAGTARLRRAGMSVHLGGIGKGYAVDRGSAILHRRGIADFMIQAGGDLYVAERPDERPWRLGIQDPRGPPATPFAVVELENATFSTSGDYERFFLKDGRRYHHILDPDLGMPAMASRSVTIVAKRAVDADALSTAVFVLGPDAGMALIEQLPDIEGVIVGPSSVVRVSSGLEGKVTILAPPRDGP